MIPAMPDVNVLVALFDPAHPNHEDAHRWFGRHRRYGWATCPLTANGCVRVLSSPAYPTVRATTAEVMARLRTLCAAHDHRFWPDDVSLLDEALFHPGSIPGPQAITGVYLLALAHRHGGRLVTFDRSIPLGAVAGAAAGSLLLLGARPLTS
jgi:hypothetical protein